MKYRGIFPEFKFGHVFGKNLKSQLPFNIANKPDGSVLLVTKVGGLREVFYEKGFVQNEEAFVGWLGGFRWL